MEKICQSWLNIKNKNTRCHRECCANSDFCKYHKRYAKYMETIKTKEKIISTNTSIIINKDTYKILDEKYSENLFGIYDSWKEIPEKFWINLNNKYWDIRILINVFSNQLIGCEMENPKPSYPHDPYTRYNFSPEELNLFMEKCKSLKIKMYIALKKILQTDLTKIYLKQYGTTFEMSNIIIENLSVDMRYKIVNNKNSQDSYIGYWIPKHQKFSYFESMYKLYNSLSYQTFMYDDGDLYVMENQDKYDIKKIIDSLSEEKINLNSDDICVLI